MTKKCGSCGMEVMESYVEFECPQCGEGIIVRCKSCRVLGVKYVCDKCGFKGP